jgi:lysophospholipase L1-like esterase
MIRLVLATVVGVVWTCSTLSAQLCGQGYDAQVADIHARANRLEGNKPRLVMLGSSSFRFWPSTDTVFSHFDVVNAGFGGSCFQDAWRLRDTLIYALDPDVLLIYEGDNDVHDRVPVDDVVGTASMLLDEVSLRMPNLEVVVVAAKASPARYHLKTDYLKLNNSLRLVAMNHGAHWVDFWDVQHKGDGALREDLFIADRLHLNDEGYALWVRELRRQLPWLDPAQP